MIILLFGCGSNDGTTVSEKSANSKNQIIGSWKLVEASISISGPQYLQEIENGEEFEFLDNGKFSSNKYDECKNGKFSLESNELSLIYDCNGFTP